MGAKQLKVALWTDFERYRQGTPEYAEFSQAYYFLLDHGADITVPQNIVSLGPEGENPTEEDLERALEDTTYLFIINPGGLEEKMHNVIEKAKEEGARVYLTEKPLKRNGAGYAPVRDFITFHKLGGRYELFRAPYLLAEKPAPQSADE